MHGENPKVCVWAAGWLPLTVAVSNIDNAYTVCYNENANPNVSPHTAPSQSSSRRSNGTKATDNSFETARRSKNCFLEQWGSRKNIPASNPPFVMSAMSAVENLFFLISGFSSGYGGVARFGSALKFKSVVDF